MKETIYLRISRRKVEGMTKSMPSLYKDEIPVKLTVIVDEKAFREPTIEKEVVINDWQSGIDIADVNFDQSFITPDEAEQVRKMRIEKMKSILENNGYSVQPADKDE